MRRTKGFSLIELMVAVAILGIIAAIAIPSYSAYVIRAQRSAAKAVLLQVAQSAERYYTTNGYYPKSWAPSLLSAGVGACAAVAPMDSNTTTYCVTGSDPSGSGAAFLLAATPCGDSGSNCTAASSNMAFVDPTCDILKLDNTGVKYALNGTASAAVASQCWQQ
jgi:type IV pilus assembly protein PilE